MARRKRSPKFSDGSSTPASDAPESGEPPSPDDPTAALTSPIDLPDDQPSSAPAAPAASTTDRQGAVTEDAPPAEVQGNGKSNGHGGNGSSAATMVVVPEVLERSPDTDGEPAPGSADLPAEAAAGEVADDGGTAEPDEAGVEDAPPEAGDDGPAHSPGSARRARQRAIRAALATLPVPDPEPGFWAGIDVALAEQKPLAITARPAIRPITEPPPLSQPRPGDHRDESSLRLSPRPSPREGKELLADHSSRRKLIFVIVAFVVGLLVVGSTLAEDDDDPLPGSTTSSSLEGEVTTTQPGATTTTALPQIRGLATRTVMTPAGVGPLLVGSRLGDLDSQSIDRTVDQATFEGSGGRCFDVRLPAMGDLTLRYRSPDPARGVSDPAEAVLASIGISTQVGSNRGTETAMGLRAPVGDVRRAHEGNLDIIDDPYLPGGEIYLVPATDGSGNGLAYTTDGSVVTAISVGTLDTISSAQPCI